MPTECVIGVDLGGTNLKVAAVGEGLEVRSRAHRVIAGMDRPTLLDEVVGVVDELRREVEVDAVGFGVAALIDSERGVAVSSTHLPLVGVPFGEVMTERLGVPVAVDNDANLALLAEGRHGAAAGARVALMVALGTGVGGGVMVDGELYRGAQGVGAELGHLIVEPDGRECGPGCPSRGCLEAYVSGRALAREARAQGLPPFGGQAGEIEGPAVTELARAGDPVALRLLEELGEWLGIGLVSLARIFDPDVIVIGGGVSAAGELILEPARRLLRERAPAFVGEHVEVRQARFGADSGMLGAAIFARESATRRVAA